MSKAVEVKEVKAALKVLARYLQENFLPIHNGDIPFITVYRDGSGAIQLMYDKTRESWPPHLNGIAACVRNLRKVYQQLPQTEEQIDE